MILIQLLRMLLDLKKEFKLFRKLQKKNTKTIKMQNSYMSALPLYQRNEEKKRYYLVALSTYLELPETATMMLN